MYEYPHKETPNYAAEGEGFDRDVMEYGMQNEGKAGKSKEDLTKLCEISDKDVCGNITKVVCNRGTVGDKEIIVIGYDGASLLKYSERGLEHVQDFGEIRKKHIKVMPGIEDRISDGNFDDTGNIIMLSRRDLIFGIDKRTNKVEHSIQVGNRDGKLVFSNSTVNSGQIMVGGRNGDILVYDIRKTSVNCLTKVGGAHSHWVNGLESNSNFEQLLISGGSDGLVNLYNIESVSKGVTLDEEEEEEPADFGRIREDRIVKQYETHDAGVYSVHWSLSNPWMFASLSIDGRFIVNSVPQYEKNKILSI
ncbi:Protein TSSC1 [Zancudomyces culisetae]|uniref:Protein TSSC1 n=1 Tax=Zancudomyces culisetae TaxID=1213189 RepID=A0A1R1PC21_ZANCU|nr:Protein TSSC1 [Zancudomyces culisetae]|eukprot:OMH78503.1 Protein TSSC1 [Zancudomyces culisetae]